MTQYCEDCRKSPAEVIKLKHKGTTTQLIILCNDCQRKYWQLGYTIEPFKPTIKTEQNMQCRETMLLRPSE
jgi:hypothetical protein